MSKADIIKQYTSMRPDAHLVPEVEEVQQAQNRLDTTAR